MRWRKLGRVFTANRQRPWMQSHTATPFAEPIGGDRLRIWFSPQDDANRWHLAWLEIDVTRPQYIHKLAQVPTLAPGPKGRFDDQGTMGSWLTDLGAEQRLYYIGWTSADPNPYQVAIGLAIGHDKGTSFSRRSPNAIFDRNDSDPIYVSAPCVLKADPSWHMWYVTAIDWPKGAAAPDSTIRHATSKDGVSWVPDDGTCVEFQHTGECGLARPCVVMDNDCWRMWFCYRTRDSAFRIGYAESPDGESWTRNDDRGGLDTGSEDWDSEMVAYPHVFDLNGERYMLYSGNGFGEAGMGLAVLETD